jgi:hypothetical protein
MDLYQGEHMVSKRIALAVLVLAGVLAAPCARAQTTEGPEDPASSQTAVVSRTRKIATGYLRTLLVAQREYKKKNNAYATSLAALVGKGSFTRRMAQRDRGDYTVGFHSNGEEFSVELVPKVFDPEHPAYYMDESGVIRSEPDKIATASSPEAEETAR